MEYYVVEEDSLPEEMNQNEDLKEAKDQSPRHLEDKHSRRRDNYTYYSWINCIYCIRG